MDWYVSVRFERFPGWVRLPFDTKTWFWTISRLSLTAFWCQNQVLDDFQAEFDWTFWCPKTWFGWFPSGFIRVVLENKTFFGGLFSTFFIYLRLLGYFVRGFPVVREVPIGFMTIFLVIKPCGSVILMDLLLKTIKKRRGHIKSVEFYTSEVKPRIPL